MHDETHENEPIAEIEAHEVKEIQPPPTTKPNRSTGPTSQAGKAKSSMNRLTHGLRSEKAILRDEDPLEYESTVQGWLDIYQPQDRKEDELVGEIIHAHWQLKRCRKRLEEIEYNLPGNAWNWTDEHQKLYSNFTRYKTTAERSFNRWYREMKSYRGRQLRADQIAEKAHLAAAAVDLQWLTKEERKASLKLKAEQVVEIEIEDGETVTNCYPSNEELVEFYSKRSTQPVYFKRFLIFVNGIPPEYLWASAKDVEASENPQAVQTMTWTRWLDLSKREEASGTGHIGPLYSAK